jgi:Arylsulfotransferase (ASST)
VRFQWTSLAHVPLQASYAHASRTSTSEPYDFFHLNSIARDRDGSLLISARNTWASYDIDPRSGRIIWSLGGKQSTFALGPGVATAWQHDPRQLADGSISLFDNGASPRVHPQSRGVVITLDAVHRKARLLRQIIRPAALLAESQGNMQALANGDWLIGWGEIPDVSEFSPEGGLLFDAHLPAGVESYRAFRFPWAATPAHPPVFAVRQAAGAPATVFASWNGATGVAAWRVLAGARPDAMAPAAQSPRAGFETAIAVPGVAAGSYMSVQALDAAGQVLGTAATARLGG